MLKNVMPVETTYTSLRENLSSVLDQVIDDQEVVIVKRKGRGRDVAMLPAAELSSLRETLHLMSSPKNAARLLAAEARADSHRGRRRQMTVEQLKAEVGLGD
jgi:antitoxin YefM